MIARILGGGAAPSLNPAEIPLPSDEPPMERAPSGAPVSRAANGLASGSATPAAMPADDVPIVYVSPISRSQVMDSAEEKCSETDHQVASARDLDGEFAKMLAHFEGKETEHNWTPREKAVLRLRGMLRGEVHRQYRDAFVAGLKNGMLEGITKTVSHIHTPLASEQTPSDL